VIITGTQSGKVTAVSENGGTIVWEHVSQHVVDTLVSGGNVVYVAAHVAPANDRYQRANLAAFRVRDGMMLWHTMEEELRGHVTMSLDRDKLFVSSSMGDGTFYAINGQTGTVLWTYGSADGMTNKFIAAHAGVVYLHEGHSHPTFTARDANTGAVLWSFDQEASPAYLVAYGSFIYVYGVEYLTGSRSIIILSAKDGGEVARLTLEHKDRSLAISESGGAYIVRNRQVYALQASDGAIQWHTGDVGSPGEHSVKYSRHLIVADELLYYVQTLQPEMRIEVGALDARTGRQRWRWHGEPSLASAINAPSLVSAKTRVYLATRQGVLAFNGADGHLLWQTIPDHDLSFIVPAISSSEPA